MSENRDGPFVNTDRELWREQPGDYYASSVHVTESGMLGINVGGMVFVKSLRRWHEAAKAQEAKDAAYAERNQCVALLVRMALALGWRAGIRDHEDKPGEEWEPDWRSLVCIDLPTGQVSWHFHDSEKHLLAGLPQYSAPWDGHDTAEKYRRVNAALPAPRPPREP